MNHTTEASDVLEVLDWLEHAPIPEPPSDAPAPTAALDREPGVWLPWVADAVIDAQTVQAIPLFRTLGHDLASELARAIRGISIEAGHEVLHQWEGSRDLYVVLDGAAQVKDQDRVLGELGPGDVFGEVAALEWGAEFGYARTATFTALSPMRVLIVPQPALSAVLREAPDVADELRQLAQRRISRE